MLLGQRARRETGSRSAHSHGSSQLVAPGAGLAADLSGVLTFGALVVVYAVLMWRRAHAARGPRAAPVAVLALLLALMTFGKVLSPQYFIWLLPALALVAAATGSWACSAPSLLLTQVEFPALYWNLVDLQPGVLLLVSARNLLLAALFCVTLWKLALARPRPARAGLPPGSPAERGTPASPATAAPAPSSPA